MSNVIRFPGNKNAAASAKPAGSFDTFPEQHGMVLIDGCIPAAVMPALLALIGTAGVTITENA